MALYEIIYLSAIPLVIAAEHLFARNTLTRDRYDRWLNNMGFGFINEVIRLSSPIVFSALLIEYRGGTAENAAESAIESAIESAAFGMALLPPLAGLAAAFLLFDFGLYWLHRMNHQIHLLWRLHRTHHSDVNLDFSTTFRHHPGEFVVSLVIIFFAMAALGLTAEQVIPYFVVLRFVELFAHSNIGLSPRLDSTLATVIVTPGVHQIHHSGHQPETDSNYGQVLTLWDRLFGTFISPNHLPVPEQFGLTQFRSAEEQRLLPLLIQPFR